MIISKSPVFMFNPKSYLYGEKLYGLVQYADQLASEYELNVFVTAPFAELKTISDKTNHIVVTAQHMDPIQPGRGMGAVLPEAIYQSGARACVLNHAEHPITYSNLEKSIY